jgi:hypothetical protein
MPTNADQPLFDFQDRPRTWLSARHQDGQEWPDGQEWSVSFSPGTEVFIGRYLRVRGLEAERGLLVFRDAHPAEYRRTC